MFWVDISRVQLSRLLLSSTQVVNPARRGSYDNRPVLCPALAISVDMVDRALFYSGSAHLEFEFYPTTSKYSETRI